MGDVHRPLYCVVLLLSQKIKHSRKKLHKDISILLLFLLWNPRFIPRTILQQTPVDDDSIFESCHCKKGKPSKICLFVRLGYGFRMSPLSYQCHQPTACHLPSKGKKTANAKFTDWLTQNTQVSSRHFDKTNMRSVYNEIRL